MPTPESRPSRFIAVSNAIRNLVARVSGKGKATLYVHYPCFDGIASGVIAADYLANVAPWKTWSVKPVDYTLAKTWLATKLDARSVVVDFLYHPEATFWADHHATAFLNEEARRSSEAPTAGRTILYDRHYPSCAKLLFDNLREHLSDEQRYRDLAFWANKIDSADYESAEEAMFSDEPAIEINLSLSDPSASSLAYCNLLFRSLSSMTVRETAALPSVRALVRAVRERERRGLDEVRRSLVVESSNMAVFSAIETDTVTVNRYSPYAVLPDARYSVGLVQRGGVWKITAMRNPWIDFDSVELGHIFSAFGGGGHRRVASLLLSEDEDAARAVLRDIVAEIRTRDAGIDHGPRRAYA